MGWKINNLGLINFKLLRKFLCENVIVAIRKVRKHYFEYSREVFYCYKDTNKYDDIISILFEKQVGKEVLPCINSSNLNLPSYPFQINIPFMVLRHSVYSSIFLKLAVYLLNGNVFFC